MIMSNIFVISVNVYKLNWLIVIINKGDAMYLDSGGGSPCFLFNKILDAMMDKEMNLIIIPYLPQQNDRFSCGVFVFGSYEPLLKTWDCFEKTRENSSLRVQK